MQEPDSEALVRGYSFKVRCHCGTCLVPFRNHDGTPPSTCRISRNFKPRSLLDRRLMQIHFSAESDVSGQLLLNKDRVIQVWEDRLRREIPAARALPEPLLKNSLPGWLDRLIAALAAPDSNVKLEKLSSKSREHGSQRADLHFDLNELLYEYTILRQVLISEAEMLLTLSPRQRDIILNAVDVSVRGAVSEYVSKQRIHFQRETIRGSEIPITKRALRTVGIVSLFALVQWLAWPILQPLYYILFYPAVTFAALFGSAPLAIFLSVFAVEWIFHSHPILTQPDWPQAVRIATFIGSALLISHITGRLRSSRRMALAAFTDQEEARMDAERTVASLDALLGSAPFGVGFLDRDLRYVRVNELLAKWNGHPADFHVGKSLREIIGDAAPIAQKILGTVIETGAPAIGFEYEAPLGDDPGRFHTLLSSFYPVRTGTGEILGVGAIILDITEQKESANELRKQKERLDLAIRAGEIGVWEFNQQSGQMIWTDRQYQIFGMSPDEPIDWERFTQRIHPEDREATLEKIKQRLRQSERFLFEIRISNFTSRWPIALAAKQFSASARR